MEHVLERLLAWAERDIATFGRVLLIVVLAAIALRLIGRVVPRLREAIAMRRESAEDGQRVRTLSRVLRYALTVAVTVVAGIQILGEFGVSIAPVIGAAGVVGVALGFGAQSLVKDYFTGFFLLLENQIRIGDVVEAGGKSGVVEELTLRYLRLRDYDGNVHYVPNGSISTVTNMSLGFAYAVIDAGVGYGEDLDRVMQVMRDVGAQLRRDPAFAPKILDEIEIAGVESWAQSSVLLRCRFRVSRLEQWSVRREYLRRLKMAFDERGIEIPFPHVKVLAVGSSASSAGAAAGADT